MKMKPYKIKAEIVFIPNSKSIEAKMFFECDGKACEKCNNENCHLTKDIKHAKRFDLLE